MSAAATNLLHLASAELPASETALSPAERFQSYLRGIAVAIVLVVTVAIAGLFLSAALFHYSVGELI
jgi:hypothetical protein